MMYNVCNDYMKLYMINHPFIRQVSYLYILNIKLSILNHDLIRVLVHTVKARQKYM